MIRVHAVVLTYNGMRWIDACLESLRNGRTDVRIIVVDNASTDGSAERVRSRYPEALLVRNRENLGFAKGCNIGIRQALGEGASHILLLNQDARADAGCVDELIRVAGLNPGFGILSPMQYDYEGEALDPNFRRILRTWTGYESDVTKKSVKTCYPAPEIIGAAALLTRRCLERVGLFDPLYFCYGEDSDLCARAAYHDFKAGIVTGARIFHRHGLLHGDNAVSAARLKGAFVFCLKDHGKNFPSNALNYARLLIHMLRRCGPKHLARLLAVQIWVALRVPLILMKRRIEKTRPCYIAADDR